MSDINELIAKIQRMRESHDWQSSDTPNTLVKSLVIEANELLEVFDADDLNIANVESELADVLMYALTLAHDLGLDVEEAIVKKIAEVNTRVYEE